MIDFALSMDWIPEHLFGGRQDKTLHARLSEDIARNLDGSRFYRTAPGVFFLRSLLVAASALPLNQRIYFAPQRRKEISKERILTIKRESIPNNGDKPVLFSISALKSLLDESNYRYMPIKVLSEDRSYVAIHSFVVVHRDNKVLSFRAGRFFPVTDPLYGARSIGIGGAVYSSDADMLYESLYGIVGNGIRELAYGIGLTRRLSERARYDNEVVPWMSILHSETNKPNVLHVVMGYPCPVEFEPTKAALSINDIRWVDRRNPGNSLNDYDETSRFMLEAGIAKFMLT